MATCFMTFPDSKAKDSVDYSKQNAGDAAAAILASDKHTEETPRSWEEVTFYVKDGSCDALTHLDRSAAQLVGYNAFREKTLKKWISMQDYLTSVVFGGDSAEGEDGKLRLENAATADEKRMIVLRPNDFPYNLASGLTHDNLWSTKPLEDDLVQKLLEFYLPGRELTWWVNPTELQSMPQLWHAHIVSRLAA